MQECTDGDVLLTVAMCRVNGQGGVLLFGSGYLDKGTPMQVSAQTEAQIAVGVDSITCAFQQLAVDRRTCAPGSSRVTPPSATAGAERPNSVGDMLPGADDVNFDDLGGLGDLDENWDALHATEEGEQGLRNGATPLDGDQPGNDALLASVPGPVADGSAGTLRVGTESERGQPGPSQARTGGDGVAAGDNLIRGASPSASQPRGRSALAPRPSSSPQATISRYTLASDFVLPGLVALPPRTLMPSGRGSAMRDPPPAPRKKLRVPVAEVEMTLAELGKANKAASVRTSIDDFSDLYKCVVDVVVKRTRPEESWKAKVNHSFKQLTPEAVRNMEVTLVMPEGRVLVEDGPQFLNMSKRSITGTLAVILVMKNLRDPFFVWVLFMFSEGARAPAEGAGGAPAGNAGGIGKKRARPSVETDGGRGGAAGAAVDPVRPGAGGSGKRAANQGAATTNATAGGAAAAAVELSATPRLPAVTTAGGAAAVLSQGSATAQLPGGSTAGASALGPGAGERYACDMIVSQLGARDLLQDGRVVATAELHPEFTDYHSAPIPVSLVAGFLRSVAAGCHDFKYAFGQDPAFCLEKGYPSDCPVPLSAIGRSYKLLWPAASIGFVYACCFMH